MLAGKTVTLGQGGTHLMVFGLDPNLSVGDIVELSIKYRQGDKDTASQTVKARIISLEAANNHAAHGS